jgi:hypothetical protein
VNPCACGCGGLARRRFIRGHNNSLRAPQPLNERVAIEPRGFVTPCWIWQGYKIRNGYGRLGFKGRQVLAHRYSYELHREPIPEGLTIDHLCRVRACVNPDHLEAVTGAENIRRGGIARRRASVEALRDLRQQGLTLAAISKQLGLSQGRISTLLKEAGK